jgi:ATP-binding cassette subfamily B protein
MGERVNTTPWPGVARRRTRVPWASRPGVANATRGPRAATPAIVRNTDGVSPPPPERSGSPLVDSLPRWIWRYLSRYRGSIAALAGLSCAEVALRVLSPWPMKLVVDGVVGRKPMPAVAMRVVKPFASAMPVFTDERERMLSAIVVIGLAAQIAHQLVMLAHSRLQSATGHRMVRDLREELFAHVQKLPLKEHASRPSADMMYRLESDATCLEHLVLRGLFPIVFSAFTLVAMFGILVRLDTSLAVLSLVILPVLFGWLRYYTTRMQPAARNAKQRESAMVQRLHDALGAIRLVKGYAREEHEQRRFARAASDALDARIVTSRQDALFGAVVTMLTVTGTAAIVIVGGVSVLRGSISLGTLLLLVAYLGFVYGPLCGIANTTGALQQAVASARRIREAFRFPAETTEDAPSAPATNLKGHLAFERVIFHHPGSASLLRNVTFNASPGEIVAVVGNPGSGKTTIGQLLVRAHETTSGRITIDGRDVRELPIRLLRRVVAVASQDVVMLAGTIRENIRYGRLDATDAEIEEAARAVGAHEFIMAQSQGYETTLGERGGHLSTGEKQLVSITRAFLSDAPILVLDDVTIAMDAVSEDTLFESVRRLRRGRTTIVLAQRPSAARCADRVLVLHAGELSIDLDAPAPEWASQAQHRRVHDAADENHDGIAAA